jgi:tetratricopeptide (TPR) repeat protein
MFDPQAPQPPEMVVSLERLRERGLVLHRAARFAEAERIYADVLRRNPADLTALICSAAALRELGRPDEAVARARTAIALQPTVEAYCHCGAALRDLGRLAEAIESFDQAIALQPQSVEAHNNRGIALQGLQRTAEALASFDRALALRPASAELHNNRGNVLCRLQRFREALASYEQAIALQPGSAAVHNNRGLVLQALRRYREAANSYQRALALQPDLAEAHNNLGTALCELGRHAEALASCRRALELQPAMRGVHGNIGNALRELERPEEALVHYELALLEEPRQADNLIRRANVLFDLLLIPQAIADYERAIELNPGHAQAHLNMSFCLMLSGDLARGLRSYESRKQLQRAAEPAVAAPEWAGEQEISGKTLFVHADQGFGDTIQICRYAKLAEARGARVVLAVQPQLRELLSGLSPTIRVIVFGEPPGRVDYRCALMSLPFAFRTTLADIPAAVPYLRADPLLAARWRQRLGEAGFKVGIVWQGSRIVRQGSRERTDSSRSIPLELFRRLASVTGVRLISLQKGDGLEQLRAGAGNLAVEDLGADFDTGTFLDTAAVMANLDLVVTCDTGAAHLAGALGRPTWIALKHVPAWMWLLDRVDSPWYPSARLFRQPRRGDWDGVFAAIHQELASLARDAR